MDLFSWNFHAAAGDLPLFFQRGGSFYSSPVRIAPRGTERCVHSIHLRRTIGPSGTARRDLTFRRFAPGFVVGAIAR